MHPRHVPILCLSLLAAACSRADAWQAPEPSAPAPAAEADLAAAAESPFEWAGVYELGAAGVTLRLQPGPGDASMRVLLLPVAGPTAADFDAVCEGAESAFTATPVAVQPGGALAADGRVRELALVSVPMQFAIAVPSPGVYACFTEHLPWEFDAELLVAGTAIEPLHERQFPPQLVQLTPVAVQTAGIRIGKAQRRQLDTTVTAPARVAFNREAMAHVGSPLRGWVVELPVRLGDTVEQGQPLLVVESPELGEAQSDFLLKRTAAEAAVPAVDLAKNAYDRADALYRKSQGLSLTEVQRRESEYRAAQAARRSAESAMTAAENRLHLLGMGQAEVQRLVETAEVSPRYTRLAPIAGTVVEREVTLGELVGPEQEALLVLADLHTLWVLADVPEARASEVRIGAKAVIGTVGSAIDQVEGEVSYLSPIVDLATRSVQVRIAVRGGTAGLRAGMFARVEITASAPGDAPVLAIPEAAVQRIDGRASVFVPVPDQPGSFARRLVRIGAPIGGMVQVFSGLEPGERVVTAGNFILKAELGKAGAHHDH